MTGAAITVLALAEPFIAAGAAVGFWYFFPTEKGLGPRGYERNEMIKCLVGTTKHKGISYLMKIRSLPLAKSICVLYLLPFDQAITTHFFFFLFVVLFK